MTAPGNHQVVADPGWSTRVVGYSASSPNEILDTALRGHDWTAFAGDYIVVAERSGSVHLLSSTIAARPYFYSVHPEGGFVHGANVFKVHAARGTPWEWSGRALRSVALYGHTIGRDTLHPRIYRMPAATHLHWNGSQLVERTMQPLVQRRTVKPSAALEASFDALVASFVDLPAGPLTVSLSAGYDSRLLFALALEHRYPLRVVSMGTPESTDLQIARRLAERSGLPLSTVVLAPEDYRSVASAATWATGGTKTAENWHTAIYPLKAGMHHSEVHLVGSNGEFARTFYLPQTLLSERQLRVLSALPGQVNDAYWMMRLLRRRVKFSSALSFISAASLKQLFADVMEAQRDLPRAPTFGDQLDLTYALSRVRHFIGNGLALYSMNGQPCSPFLDRRWIEAAYALPRKCKVQCAFHLYALSRLRHGSTDLPFNGRQHQGGRSRQVSRVVGYSAFASLFEDQPTIDRILGDNGLDMFMSRPDRELALRQRRVEDVSLLITLSATLECIAAASARRPLQAACSRG
jgi:hypothetical protein